LINHVPILYDHDFIIPITLLAWFLVHYSPNDFLNKFLNTFLGRLLASGLFHIFRTNAIITITTWASEEINDSAYFDFPVFGPPMIGALCGSMSLFMPLSIGLRSIQKDIPIGIQTALFIAWSYHIFSHPNSFFFHMIFTRLSDDFKLYLGDNNLTFQLLCRIFIVSWMVLQSQSKNPVYIITRIFKRREKSKKETNSKNEENDSESENENKDENRSEHNVIHLKEKIYANKKDIFGYAPPAVFIAIVGYIIYSYLKIEIEHQVINEELQGKYDPDL